MLKGFEYEGYWTRAGSTVRVPGTLKYSAETGCQLRLNGAFDPAPTFIGFGGGPEVREKVIHGVTNGGKPVTLLDSLHEDGEMYFNVVDAYPTATYRIGIAFIGEKFADANDARFKSLTVGFPNLAPFIGISGIRGESRPLEPGTPYEACIIASLPKGITFALDGWTVTTLHRQAFSGTFNRRVIEEQAWFEIETNEPKPLDEFLSGPVRSLHTLLELAVDEPIPVSMITGESGSGNEVDIIRSQRVFANLTEIEHETFLPFTLKALGERCSSVVQKWHQARTLHGPTFDLFFSVMRNSDMPVEHKFLFLVQALESFHRGTRPNEVDDPALHAARVEDVITAAPDEHRSWLRERIGRFSNEPTLARRLKELYDTMPEQVRKYLGDRKKFARDVSVTRNYFTHFSPDLRAEAVTERHELWAMIQQLSGVLKVLFLQVLEVDPVHVLENTAWGNFLQQRMQRAAQLRSKTTAAT